MNGSLLCLASGRSLIVAIFGLFVKERIIKIECTQKYPISKHCCRVCHLANHKRKVALTLEVTHHILFNSQVEIYSFHPLRCNEAA